MLNKNLLYLKKGNYVTIIKNSNGCEFEINTTINKLINDECIKYLSTMQGRIDAIKIKYKINKNVPIFINKDIILINTHNIRSVENIYINFKNILKLEKKDIDYTRITFVDKSELIINKNISIFKNYINKCKNIENTENAY